jgi:hypothetical protein
MPTSPQLLKEARRLAIHYGHDIGKFHHWDSYSISYCRSCDWPLKIEHGQITAHWVVCTKTSLARRAKMSWTVSVASPAISVLLEKHVTGTTPDGSENTAGSANQGSARPSLPHLGKVTDMAEFLARRGGARSA